MKIFSGTSASRTTLFLSSAIATSFFLGVTRRLKNVASLIYFMMFNFLGYSEKLRHVQGQKRSIVCAYREKWCKVIVVRMHIDYLFPIGKKNDWK